MASRIELFQVTVPAGTPQGSPAVTPLPFNDGVVTELIVTVPPGPSGLAGFRILYGAQPVIPYTGTAFVVADNRVIDWKLEDFPQGGAWQFQGYNTDIFPHTFYLEFMISEVPLPVPPPVPLLPIGQ